MKENSDKILHGLVFIQLKMDECQDSLDVVCDSLK